MQLQTKLKDKPGARDAFLEFARFSDGYLFDELSIKAFEMAGVSVRVSFVYRRLGQEFPNMQPVEIPAHVLSEARVRSGGDKQRFAETDFVKRIFAAAAHQFIQQHRAVETDLFKDMDFLAALQTPDA